jgi:hypothetical protein
MGRQRGHEDQGGRLATMAYPGNRMWDSAIRTALRRPPDWPRGHGQVGEAALPGTASLSYTEGDTTVRIKATLEVTSVGDASENGEEP